MGTLRNSVHLIGRPGMDPEIKKFGENRKLAKFTLATNEKHYNDNMELVQETEWHNIIAWGRTAEIVEKIVRKGRLMALEGKLQTRQYDDKEKNKRYVTEVVMDEFMLIDKMSNDDESKGDAE
ncbi:MAG: single-stranded DNA-binding protein [Bacteroidales bacterium]|nr:single-stranded DNA-binding protein [Bacteroidales bacterium]